MGWTFPPMASGSGQGGQTGKTHTHTHRHRLGLSHTTSHYDHVWLLPRPECKAFPLPSKQEEDITTKDVAVYVAPACTLCTQSHTADADGTSLIV